MPRELMANRGHDVLLMVVAVFGTTISPYLFFWQAGAGGRGRAGRRRQHRTRPHEVRHHLRRIKLDTIVGMAFSNLIAFFIILSTAATLHATGTRDIQTSAQAAEALRPLAGELTFLLFSLGIIGTGMLAVPVLAGSAAYAVAEAAGWRGSLSLRLDRGEGRGFYGVIAAATVGGVILCFTPLDPVKELFWSRGAQWRDRGADHGRDDVAGHAPRHDGRACDRSPPALAGLVGHGVDGGHGLRIVRDALIGACSHYRRQCEQALARAHALRRASVTPAACRSVAKASLAR